MDLDRRLVSAISRRSFLAGAAFSLPAAYSLALQGCGPASEGAPPSDHEGSGPLGAEVGMGGLLFRISLAEWSLHRALNAGELTNLDFPALARTEYGIGGVEYVNSFFKDKAEDTAYLTDLRTRCEDHDVTSVLIMCDGEGALGDPDLPARVQAVENHYRWVEAARFLGCHSIRVNAQSQGTPEEQRDLAADGLRRLVEFADTREINVLVENHGGLSSNGAWLASVMQAVDHPRCGTLPDFGNFNIGDGESYDRYQGIEELMPYAKAVSAKCHIFDDEGKEAEMDYFRIMRIVLQAGYRGWVGIEYEGTVHTEDEGVRYCNALLENVRDVLTPEFQAS
jgi:sugar phosphate isomerase/epimerase